MLIMHIMKGIYCKNMNRFIFILTNLIDNLFGAILISNHCTQQFIFKNMHHKRVLVIPHNQFQVPIIFLSTKQTNSSPQLNITNQQLNASMNQVIDIVKSIYSINWVPPQQVIIILKATIYT